MSPFAAVLGGGGAGLGGAAAAHVLVTLANRMAAPDLWFKGPYGPPFFNISLFSGIYYGILGLGLGRRAREAALGFMGPFLGIILPMTVLTHTMNWGGDQPTPAWVRAVTVVFVLATWGTIFALGCSLGGARRWRAGLGGVAGAFSGYLLLALLQRLAPGINQAAWSPFSLLPAPAVLLDGILSGVGMSLGITLTRRNDEKALDA